jgi:small-conductance mechanosensitive channel
MQERRVLFTIGVTYETPRHKLEKIAGAIQAIIVSHPKTRFDRCHLARFGNFSIDYECVYYVLDSDYTVYMDLQHQINMEIHEMLEQLNVEFAYPTQKLFVAQVAL